eukprot:s2591_g17.t1
MTTRLLKILAASRGYQIYSFDVSTAFLSGKATDREIYVRAPTTGLPKVELDKEVYRAIRPLELMQVLKSAYGLTESPRLWYLEAKDGMADVDLLELAASRSVFLASEGDRTWAMCALHVDDGLLVGDNTDEKFVNLRKKIDQRFNIKEWQFLEEGKPLNFLGVELHKEKDGFTDRMDKYVQGIEPPEAPRGKPETPLTPEQVTSLRRLVMKMRWPAQHTMPQETAEEAKEEERRRGLRKAQRQRRKDRMKGLNLPSPAASGGSILAASRRTSEELQLALEETDKDAREAEALNGHLQRRVDEMEVQIAALRQYEAEFDSKVTKMLDERDEALTVAAKDKEAILLKVKELQEELALRRTPEGLADASELAMMLKERQLEVEDLLDRNEELEEDLAKAREELEQFRRGPPRPVPPPPDASSLSFGIDIEYQEPQMEERLRNLKADALEKDARLLDAEKKLEQLARGMGAEAILAENRQLTRDNADMKRQVGEAKRDLSNYLSEAASIVYENDLLRSIANVKPEQLKLKDFKLKDKVTSAKAMAAAKQLEKEVSELESERTKLKLRLRQLSELAAEMPAILFTSFLCHQRWEIAARMRQGKLELPLDDQSQKLKEERDELKKRLSMKDQDIAQHVDRKVEEVLKKQGVTKDLEAKVAALDKDNEMLKSSLEAYRAAYADLAGGEVQGIDGRPIPRPPGFPRPPPTPGHQFGLAAPSVLPRIPGMQPLVWSSLLQAGLQLPAELADGAPETVCSLYCQELSRERQLRTSLGEEVSAFQSKYDKLLAEQEDYFAQKDQWLAEKKDLEDAWDSMKKCDVLEEQLKIWQRLEVGGPEATLREELMSAMTRCASLEQNESVLSRKYETEKQNHGIVKDAFDTMQKDFLEREGFLKERLSKAVLWKRRSANALRIARRKIQSMVASSDFERTVQQLQVCRQREFDLSRRQTELTMTRGCSGSDEGGQGEERLGTS